MWQVIFRLRFVEWLEQQEPDCKTSVLSHVYRLREIGPMLGRPEADTLQGTTINNLKELRVSHQRKRIRVFFAFDSLRQAIVLCAGNKQGQKRFYETMIPIAEKEFRDYLSEGNL